MPPLPPELLSQWLQPGAVMAGAVGGLGLLIGAFRNLRADLKQEMREAKVEMKEEMRAGETRVNRRIDEVKEDLKEVKAETREMKRDTQELKGEIQELKGEMRELKSLLIQALQLSPVAKP